MPLQQGTPYSRATRGLTQGVIARATRGLLIPGIPLLPPDAGKKGRTGIRVLVPRSSLFTDYPAIAGDLSFKLLESSLSCDFVANTLAYQMPGTALSSDFLGAGLGFEVLPTGVSMDPSVIRLKRNDHLRPITFLLSEGGEAANLASATAVKLIYSKVGGATIERSLAGWTNDGKCSYAWTNQDTLNPGKYRYELEVTFNSGRVQTYPEDGYGEFLVTEDLG